jgi:hypothetical protein
MDNADQGDTMADPNAPTAQGSVYTFTFGQTVFAVDAAKGGRIVRFSLGGRNILTTAKSNDDNNWGSTFWTSPQSDWNWPPPVQLDSDVYVPMVAGKTLQLTSATFGGLGLAISKKFSLDSVAGAVDIEYGIVNKGAEARRVAPWEITRVAAGGLTFFPMGEGQPSKGAQDLLKLEMAAGAAWFPYDASLISDHQKVLADGHEGWIAHVTDDLLLVKVFGDIAPVQAAPGEGEIEIYADPTHSYIEVENQGAYVSLSPGASTTWAVRWFLRELPSSISKAPGSTDLLAAVRALTGSQ